MTGAPFDADPGKDAANVRKHGLAFPLDGYQDGLNLYSAYFVPNQIDWNGKNAQLLARAAEVAAAAMAAAKNRLSCRSADSLTGSV